MAAPGHGGQRTPSNPAPVSGVGKNSRRTDGGPAVQPLQHLPAAQGVAPPNQYGEDTSYYAEQQTAPLAAGPQAPPVPSTPPPSGGGGGTPNLAALATPINAPSQRPGEPVTAGAAGGPGPGPEALNLPNPGVQAHQTAATAIAQLAATSNSPMLQYLASKVKSSF